MDTKENSSSAAGTALIRTRSKRISSRRNTFQPAYDLTIESRQINRVDPRNEDLWPYYLQAAYARARERATRRTRRLPPKVRAALASRLCKQLNAGPSFRLPSRSPEPIFVDLNLLHSHCECEDLQDSDQSSQDGSGDETETDEDMPVAESRFPRPVQKAPKDDHIVTIDTDDHDEVVVERQPSPEADTPTIVQFVEPPITLDDYTVADSIHNEPESPTTLEEYDEHAWKTFIEVQSHMEYLKRVCAEMQLPPIVSHLSYIEVPSDNDTDPQLEPAPLSVQELETIHAATSPQPLPTPTFPTPNPPASAPLPTQNALQPRPTNTHLEPHLLPYPSATALAKMENATPNPAKGTGPTRSDQETWSSAERHLLHRAAQQWWHWKDTNKLSKAASSGAALYRYFELVFAQAGISRSYYQLKNQWSRNERARFGRSEQRSKRDGSARDLVTSARPAAKARVQAEAARSMERSRTIVVISDDEDEDVDDDDVEDQVGGYGSQPKKARFSS